MIVICLGMILGILTPEYFKFVFPISGMVAAYLLYYAVKCKPRPRKKFRTVILCLFFIAFIFGSLIIESQDDFYLYELYERNTKNIDVTGVVTAIDKSREKTVYTVSEATVSGSNSDELRPWVILVSCDDGTKFLKANVAETNNSDANDMKENVINANITDENAINAKATKENVFVSNDQESIGNDLVVSESNYSASYASEKNGLESNDIEINVFESKIEIGDTVTAIGALYPFEHASNPGQFDEFDYYRARKTDGKLYCTEILVNDNSDTSYDYLKNAVSDFRNSLTEAVYNEFPEKEAGIVTAMITGLKTDLDSDIKDLYTKIGIAHILSISGLHISLIGMALFGLLRRCRVNLKLCVFITLTVMTLFGIMTGFSVSTQRAVIMLYCMLIGKILFTAYDGQSAAALAAIIILTMNPYMLFDSGFQLSFTAVFGVFAGNEIIRRLEIKNRILLYLIPGLFAQLASYPVILSNYYEISPYSIISNPVMLPFMSIILASGLAAGILGTVGLTAVGIFCGGPAYYLLKIYEIIAETISKLPFSNIIIGKPDGIVIGIYYVLFFTMTYLSSLKPVAGKGQLVYSSGKNAARSKRYKYNYMCIVSSILIGFLLLFIPLIKLGGDGINVYFADVGQGNCVFVNNGRCCFLYDGGSSNVKQVGKYRIIPFLKYSGVSFVDKIIISHTDADHVSGISEMIENGEIGIGEVVLSNLTDADDSFVNLCKEHGICLRFACAGDIIELSKTNESANEASDLINVIAPESNLIYSDANAASLVINYRYGSFSLLLTGDSDIFSETVYRKYLDDEVDVLQVGHHGSKYSTSDELLNTTTPVVAVISCALHNSYGHPAPETIKRLEVSKADVFKTFENGMVILHSDGESIEIRYYRHNADL